MIISDNFDVKSAQKTDITPQSFESNDGRFSIHIIDEDFFEVTFYELEEENSEYYEKENIIKFYLDSKDRDTLIELLIASQAINPWSWETVKEIQNKENKTK